MEKFQIPIHSEVAKIGQAIKTKDDSLLFSLEAEIGYEKSFIRHCSRAAWLLKWEDVSNPVIWTQVVLSLSQAVASIKINNRTQSNIVGSPINLDEPLVDIPSVFQVVEQILCKILSQPPSMEVHAITDLITYFISGNRREVLNQSQQFVLLIDHHKKDGLVASLEIDMYPTSSNTVVYNDLLAMPFLWPDLAFLSEIIHQIQFLREERGNYSPTFDEYNFCWRLVPTLDPLESLPEGKIGGKSIGFGFRVGLENLLHKEETFVDWAFTGGVIKNALVPVGGYEAKLGEALTTRLNVALPQEDLERPEVRFWKKRFEHKGLRIEGFTSVTQFQTLCRSLIKTHQNKRPHEQDRYAIEYYEICLIIEPLVAQQHWINDKISIACDNKAEIIYKLKFKSSNTKSDPYHRWVVTRGNGYVINKSINFENIAPVSESYNTWHGHRVDYRFNPNPNTEFVMSTLIYGGFSAENRDMHFHLGQSTAQYERVCLTLNLSAFVDAGFIFSLEPALYFHDTDPINHEFCRARGLGIKQEPDSLPQDGIWKWTFINKTEGVLNVSWDFSQLNTLE